MSRRTWERHRNKARDATSSAPLLLCSHDELASASAAALQGKDCSSSFLALFSSRKATFIRADWDTRKADETILEIYRLAANGGGR
jgi:hypothetical protein